MSLPIPSLTYSDLITQITAPQALQELQQLLTGSGIQGIQDWTANSPQQAFMQVAAFFITSMQNQIATNAFNSVEPNAAGDWLTNLSSANFDNQRFQGTQTEILCSCSYAPGFGPSTFTPGQVQISMEGAFNFSNTAQFTLNGNSTSVQTFIASAPASAPNSTTGGSVASLLNNIQGLTVTAVNIPSLFNGCVQVLGTDTEADPALHQRNESKWSTFTTAESPALRVKNAVLNASSGSLSDVFIPPFSPRGPGCVDVYCANPDTPATDAQISAISSSVQQQVFAGNLPIPGDATGLARCSLFAPTPVYFGSGGQNTMITVWYTPLAPLTLFEANLTIALNDWVGSIPTGGNIYGTGAANIADVDDLVAVLYGVQFVEKVRISNQSDISLLPTPSGPLKLTVIDWSAGGNWNGSIAGSVNLVQAPA